MVCKKRSGGPRTTAGKAKSRYNALRHGLARSLSAKDLAQVDAIQSRYGGDACDPCYLHFARIAAAADLEIERCKTARDVLLNGALEGSHGMTAAEREAKAIASVLPQLIRIQRYEDRAMSRRAKALQFL